MKGKPLFLLASVLIAGQLTPAASYAREEAKDTDEDGRPDQWQIFDDQQMVRIERDRDGDGKREITVFLKEGKSERAEVDRNKDGRPDMFRYYQNGQPEKESHDLNFDGRPDTWVFHKAGVKDLMIRDKNFDDAPDAWFYYGESGMKVVGFKQDTDFDGAVDRETGSIPQEETRKPWF
ncbi:MAG: hypothetical protein NC910_04510 [Candidatus Omnitrophica bacterium]|nr:hypothetical protein [Candidatus Omnitrophota bacterium]